MMVMYSAHNERKQETIVKILLENGGTSKKITLSLHGLHSLQSAWSVFQHDRSECEDLQNNLRLSIRFQVAR